jgi:tetratricopeptide (TPR) repeat protein
VGDVQGQTRASNLGDTTGAMASYRKALAIRERLAADPEIRRDLIPNYSKLSDTLWNSGDSGASMGYSRKLLALSEALATASGATRQDRVRLATSYLDYGYKQGIVVGDVTNGLANCRKSLAIFNELSADPQDRRLLRVRSIGYDRTAELLEKQPAGRAEALKLRQSALVMKTELLRQEPANTDYRRLAAWAHYDFANLMNMRGRPNEALPHYRLALDTFQKLSVSDPESFQFRQDLAIGQVGVASAYLKLHQYRDARTLYTFGLPALVRLRDTGQLQPVQITKIADAKRELEDCERALAR